MSKQNAPSNSKSGTSSDSNPRELQRNALGLLSAAAMTAAYMGPALSIYGLFGEMTKSVGQGIAFVMIIVTAITLLSAISFGMLAKEMPSAGALYAWATAAMGKSTGMFIGVTTIMYYLISMAFPPLIFGQNFNAVIHALGVDYPDQSPFWMWSWFVGALIAIVIAAYVAYRGIVVSAHLAFSLLMIEMAVVVALSITFFGYASYHGTFSIRPLTFAGVSGGWKGIFLVLSMAMMCTVCDAAVPAGEETENARRTIPIAVCLSCLMVGVWYVIGFWAFSLGPISIAGVESKTTFISYSALLAEKVWGKWSILVSLTAMTACLGAYIPLATAASRMLFAMAREGKLPRVFAKLHPDYLAPWNAIHLAFACSFLAILPAFWREPDPTLAWWSNTLGWFIGIVYFSANITNTVYYWRHARAQFSIWLNLIVPAFGAIVNLAFLGYSSIYFPWSENQRSIASTQYFMIASALITIGYSMFMRYHSWSRTELEIESVAG